MNQKIKIDRDVLFEKFNEFKQDYVNYGEGQAVEAWLESALLRLCKKSDTEAKKIAAELIKGINFYREEKKKIEGMSVKDSLSIENISPEQRDKLAGDVSNISDNILNDDDIKEIIKVVGGVKNECK